MADEWSLFARALKCSVFSVMESSFCFASAEFIRVPATSFINVLGPLRSVQAILVWKNRFDAARVLDYDVEIDERVEIVYAGFQRFRDLVTVKTQVG